ncbi:hypothetical protein [uncultured Kordia sp.]|uniref:hypothetical protein n=1 Tax=uncultured Kordia sp. TaxID=507699 RepID=UPI00261F4DC3|nr:hypothetical protein [uncultured Kordia sp.]
MLQRIILSTLLIFSIYAHAQNEKPNRDAFVLTVAVDTVNYYQQDVPISPYFVKDKILQIYPTEKLFIETEVKADSIHSMKVVKENLNPEKTIVIEFIQNVKGKNHEGMMLKVDNPFEKALRYKALMYINGRTEWIPTSIIPVRPKLSSFEVWNDVILSLVLVEWKLE